MDRLRITALKILIGVTASILFAFAVYNFLLPDYLQAILDIALAVFLLAVMVVGRLRQNYAPITQIFVAMVMLFLLYITAKGLGQGTAALWGLVIPICTFFLVGGKCALVYSLVYGGVATFLVLYPGLLAPAGTYSTHFSVRFIGIYAIITFLSFLYDYARLRNEATLEKAKEKAEIASHAKDRFIANLSHEIRTPLNAVINLTETLMGQGLTEEQLRYLKMIQLSGKSLFSVLSAILDFVHFDSGQVELKNDRISLPSLAEETLSPYQYLARETSLNFSYQVDLNMHDRIMIDKSRLQQILINLVSNSLKYTTSGEVFVHFGRMCSDVGGDDKELLEITVSDTGIGIPEKEQKALFGEFYRGEHDLNKGYDGMGLGLAIVDSLVRLMAGRIEVHSPSRVLSGKEPGTDIVLLFPLKLDKQTWSPPSTGERAVPGKLSVLIAEDNKINQTVMQSLLAGLQVKTTLVENGLQAVEAVREGQFDLVFMDIRMPVMDGLEAAMKIREFNQHIPIVAITAEILEQDRDKCLAAGMNAHLGKPISQSQLAEMIQKFVGNSIA